MHVLLTGGTGVIGEGIIPALLDDGHTIRLLTRGADKDARQWPEGVEPFAADVGDPATLAGAADGCDAVVHVSGIVREDPPEITFQKINVEGTRAVLAEAERAGVGRFIFVSSLGAETGSSDYHRSKRDAENLVHGFSRSWLVLRPGNVYGPGDEVVSSILTMVRTLPAIPMVGFGDQRFQPLWYEDMGRVVAHALRAAGLKHVTLEVAGEEITTTNELIEKFSAIVDRSPLRVPVPEFVAAIASQAAGALGIDFPLDENKLAMLLEENMIADGKPNALTHIFGLKGTPLDEGLHRLAREETPEQSPSDGVGGMERKRFWANIQGSRYSAEDLMTRFREKLSELMPLDFAAEPGSETRVEKGAILTGSVPIRGNFQMRVQEASERATTLTTLRGHFLAGAVRFTTATIDGAVQFLIEIYARAADIADWLAMNTVGGVVQNANWQSLVNRVVELSGGSAADGVQSESETLSEEEAERVEEWIEEMVVETRSSGR